MIGRRFWLVGLCVFLCGWGTFSLLAWAAENDPSAATAASVAADTIASAPASSQSWLLWLGTSLGPMYGILFLVLAFALVALVVLNVLSIRRQRLVPPSLVQACQSYLAQKRLQEVYTSARADTSLLGRVIAVGLTKLSTGYDAAVQAMQETGADEALRLEHQLGYLALVGQIAPLVGLLGTVDGLATAFEAIAARNLLPHPADLAQGIGTALVATMVSLWITIPAVVMFHILRARLTRYLFDAGVVSEALFKQSAALSEKKV